MLKAATLLACTLGALVCGGCGGDRQSPERIAGDPVNGKLLLRQYGCGSCHEIPGVAAARGNVGPPLTRVGKRIYLAGMLPNTPENMALWISTPTRIDPRTAMPDLNVPDKHVRDMVAYLYRLK
jgi:cytochrome c2